MGKFDAKQLRQKYRMLEPRDGTSSPALELADEAIDLAEALEEEVDEANGTAETLEEEKDAAERDCREAESRADDLDSDLGDAKDALVTVGRCVEDAISAVEAALGEDDDVVRKSLMDDALRALENARREVDDNT